MFLVSTARRKIKFPQILLAIYGNSNLVATEVLLLVACIASWFHFARRFGLLDLPEAERCQKPSVRSQYSVFQGG